MMIFKKRNLVKHFYRHHLVQLKKVP